MYQNWMVVSYDLEIMRWSLTKQTTFVFTVLQGGRNPGGSLRKE